MDLKKLHKWIEAVNTYYAFAVLVYAVSLYITSHSDLFKWVFIVATPIITAWTGFIIRAYLERRNHRHGFDVLSDTMTYEMVGNNHYSLRFTTKLKAATDHLVAYPIGYHWTGGGEESIPKLYGENQQILAPIEAPKRTDAPVRVEPYKLTVCEGDWHYWFVGFNPPVHRGETVNIKYSQVFHDKKRTAEPLIYYFARTPMKRLELNVKFAPDMQPKNVSCSIIKPSDPNRPYPSKGVIYDADKMWATWTIERPKKGHCYRIHWQ